MMNSLHLQGLCAFFDGGAGTSDRGVKWSKNAVSVHHCAKFPPTETQFLLLQGAICFR